MVGVPLLQAWHQQSGGATLALEVRYGLLDNLLHLLDPYHYLLASSACYAAGISTMTQWQLSRCLIIAYYYTY